jgi:hypothetical protein
MKKHQATLRIHPSVDQEAGVASYLIKKTKIVGLSNAHILPRMKDHVYILFYLIILINLHVKALKHMYAIYFLHSKISIINFSRFIYIYTLKHV